MNKSGVYERYQVLWSARMDNNSDRAVAAFEELITDSLQRGWVLHGPTMIDKDSCLFQAMILPKLRMGQEE
jgi:hypothetical protein